MAELNINATTTPSTVTDYSVDSISPDSPTDQKETYYDNVDFPKWFGNYKKIAKIKKSIDAFATWVLGQGYETNLRTKVNLTKINGWGEDTFISILWNMIVMKKVAGDSFAQIIRDPDSGTLINLKPLNPQFMRIVVNNKGRIKRYEYRQPLNNPVKFQPAEILHFSNDRVADEIHGNSVIEVVEWNIEATEEAKRTHRKMIKRNGVVRVIEVDTDDTTKLNSFKVQWKDAIDKGDVLILPKGVAEAKDWHGQLDTNGVLAWLNHLDNDFYVAVGIPKVIIGGTAENTEASAKVATLNFDPIYIREVTELQEDLFNQLGIQITLNKQSSLSDSMASSEAKNTGQVGFQPKDSAATLSKE